MTLDHLGPGQSERDYLYDGEGRLAALWVHSTGVMMQYLYDAGGSRVGQGTIAQWNNLDPTTNGFVLTNEYVLGQSGEQVSEFDGSNRWLHTNAYAGGQLLATYDTTGYGLHFHLTDWLGTHRVQTGPEGQMERSCQSLPFGEAPTCTEATDQFFTGLERDTHTGLDLAEYRQYSSTLGRWTAPDPYNGSMNFSNPQTINRYAYVGNMPLKYNDPTGLLFGVDDVYNIGLTLKVTVGIIAAGGEVDPVQDIIAGGILLADVAADVFLPGVFAHTQLKGTTQQRPDARHCISGCGKTDSNPTDSAPNNGPSTLQTIGKYAGCAAVAAGAGARSFIGVPNGASSGPPNANMVIRPVRAGLNVAAPTLITTAGEVGGVAAAEFAADAIPVVGEILLTIQTGVAIYSGVKAFAGCVAP